MCLLTYEPNWLQAERKKAEEQQADEQERLRQSQSAVVDFGSSAFMQREKERQVSHLRGRIFRRSDSGRSNLRASCVQLRRQELEDEREMKKRGNVWKLSLLISISFTHRQ